MTEGHSYPDLPECQSRSDRADAQLNTNLSEDDRHQLAFDSFDIGYDSHQVGAIELARVNFRRAVSLYDGRSPSGSGGPSSPFVVVASCLNYLGLLCPADEGPEVSIPLFDRAIELRRKLQQLCPEDRENQVYLGGVLCNRANAVARTDPATAGDFYRQSLKELQVPEQTCRCSYWDERRNSWWCFQLEARGAAAGFAWVSLAPRFVDNAMAGLSAVTPD